MSKFVDLEKKKKNTISSSLIFVYPWVRPLL